MSNGISITVDVTDFARVEALVSRLSAFDATELMSGIGAMGESQTRRRITDEKTSPDGAAWAPNREGTSILLKSGEHLLGSLAWESSSTDAEWGAAWEYAHVHQNGATIKPQQADRLAFKVGGKLFRPKQVTIPARPFVGLSADNAQEILHLVTDVFGGMLQ